MSAPTPPHSNGIKRSASEEFEEPPNKRADIASNLTPDHGFDRDRFSSDRQLVPMISRAETDLFQDYTKNTSYSNGAGNDDDDESEDEFVDAQEAVAQEEAAVQEEAMAQEEDVVQEEPSESILPISDVAGTLFNGDFMAIKKEAGNSATQEVEEVNEVQPEQPEDVKNTKQEKPEAEEVRNIKQEDLENDQSPSSEPPSFQKEEEAKVQEIKPEIISIGSDDGTKIENHGEAYDAEDEDEKVTDAEHEEKMSDAGSSDGKQETEAKQETISISDDDNETEQVEDYDDMFAATFGKNKAKKSAKVKKSVEEDDDEDGEEDASSGFSGGPKGFVSGVHKTTIRNGNNSRHPSTPSSTPPPATVSSRPAPITRRRPDVERDVSSNLLKHHKFHMRVMHLIPRLPNHENFDWSKRYWIAVMIEGKRLKNTTTEKDFVWMKGNRFSTVATVFHSYALAVMADPADLALILGSESVEMTDQMQELDYFNDKLVVFKAVKLHGNEEQTKGRSLVPGIVPASAVITLDLD